MGRVAAVARAVKGGLRPTAPHRVATFRFAYPVRFLPFAYSCRVLFVVNGGRQARPATHSKYKYKASGQIIKTEADGCSVCGLRTKPTIGMGWGLSENPALLAALSFSRRPKAEQCQTAAVRAAKSAAVASSQYGRQNYCYVPGFSRGGTRSAISHASARLKSPLRVRVRAAK